MDMHAAWQTGRLCSTWQPCGKCGSAPFSLAVLHRKNISIVNDMMEPILSDRNSAVNSSFLCVCLHTCARDFFLHAALQNPQPLVAVTAHLCNSCKYQTSVE